MFACIVENEEGVKLCPLYPTLACDGGFEQKSKKGGKDQESIEPHMTKDTTWERDKNTIKHHKQ